MNMVSGIQTNRLWTMIALSGVVLFAAACSQAAVPSANPGDPAVASQAPLPTAIPQSNNTSSIPNTADYCSLLSKDDVGTILGEAVVDSRVPSADGSVCEYQTNSMILELTTIHNFGGFGDSVQYMESIRTNGIGDAVVDVPGLGDEAFFHGSAAYRILQVRKGDTSYGFGVRNAASDQSISSPENAQALEKAMADLFFSRLP